MMITTPRQSFKDIVTHCEAAFLLSINKPLVWVKGDDKVDQAMSLMAKHNVHAVAVCNTTNSLDPIPVGFLDVLDILHWITQQQNEKQDATCGSLINFSGLNPFEDGKGGDYRITGETLAPTVLSYMLERDVRRLAVIRPDNKLVSVLSQIDVVWWLESVLKENPQLSQLASSNIEKLGIGNHKPFVISSDSTAIDAFSKIKELKVSGLGVVNQEGYLVGHVSASDIIGLEITNHFQWYSLQILSDYLRDVQKTSVYFKPITVSSSSTLLEVLELFKSTGVHKVYIVDGNTKPCGVICPIDIIKLLWNLIH